MGIRVRATGRFKATARGDQIDWRTVRARSDLLAVATALLGPAPGPGSVGSRSAWLCPFHDDHDPSFTVDAKGWRCWACGIGGDAAELVMRHRGIEFPEAIDWLAELAGIATPSGKPARPRPPARSGPARPSLPPAGPPVRSAGSPPAGPTGLPLADALALVDEAAKRLWTPEGRAALAYLEGRGLTLETIRQAGLGWTPGVMLPTSDGARSWRASGIVIPWLDGDRLAMVKIRQPDRREPRYAQAFADRPRIYPGPEAIRPGMPLIIVEGEFDAMLLGQELADLASVITTGSASTRPEGSTWLAMLRCPRWFVALDADPAGDGAAADWPARAERVRPPAEPPAGKDWGDAWKAGIDLRRWWVEQALADAFDREERAAFLEFDGGFSRGEAERLAGASPVRTRPTVAFRRRASNDRLGGSSPMDVFIRGNSMFVGRPPLPGSLVRMLPQSSRRTPTWPSEPPRSRDAGLLLSASCPGGGRPTEARPVRGAMRWVYLTPDCPVVDIGPAAPSRPRKPARPVPEGPSLLLDDEPFHSWPQASVRMSA